MNNTLPNIVCGEASETDDDGEDICGKIIQIEGGSNDPPPISIHATNYSEGQQPKPRDEDQPAESGEYFEQWRFRRIINERCVSLLNEFIHTAAASVSKQLVETDNLLLKSQVVLLNTTCSVKKINETTEQIASKLHVSLSLNFIPKINI